MDPQQTAALLKCCSQQTTETHCSEMGGEVIGLTEEEQFMTGTGGEVMCKFTQITLLLLRSAETSGNSTRGRGNFSFMHQDLSMRKRELELITGCLREKKYV